MKHSARQVAGAAIVGVMLTLSVLSPAVANPAPAHDAADQAVTPDLGGLLFAGGGQIFDYASVKATSPNGVISGKATGISDASSVEALGQQYIWATNCACGGSGTDALLEFPANGDGNIAPLVDISGSNTGIADPSDAAFTPNFENIWVANKKSLTEFPTGQQETGNVTPEAVISGSMTKLDYPDAIAVSPDGSTIYTAGQVRNGPDSFTGEILEFPANATGNVKPTRVITGPLTGMNYPRGIAVGVDGKIHVADESNALFTYAADAKGDAAPLTSLTDMDTDGPIMIDPTGDIWTGHDSTAQRITGTSSSKPHIDKTLTLPDSVSSTAVFSSPPEATGLPKAVAGNSSVKLTWSKPAVTGGGLLGYQIEQSAKLDGPFLPVAKVTKPMATISHLTAGKEVYFKVVAFNDIGFSNPSGEAGAKPFGPPGAPLSVAAKPSKTSIEVSWKPPASDGGDSITKYEVMVSHCSKSSCSGSAQNASPTTTRVTVDHLTPGTAYKVAVAAGNAAGLGSASKPVSVRTKG